jgi:hypothetical protein
VLLMPDRAAIKPFNSPDQALGVLQNASFQRLGLQRSGQAAAGIRPFAGWARGYPEDKLTADSAISALRVEGYVPLNGCVLSK